MERELEEKVGIIIQARLGSSRFPKKILQEIIPGKSVIEFIISQLESLDLPIIVATTQNKTDDELVNFLLKRKIKVFRGEEEDVLKRFIDCSFEQRFEKIIRICSDNPFLQIEFIKELLKYKNYDYVAHKIKGIPSMLTHFGLFSELVTLSALIKEQRLIGDFGMRQHVTYFIYKNPDKFKIRFIEKKGTFFNKNYRLTLDTPEDLKIIKRILKKISGKITLNKIQNVIEKDKFLNKSMKKLINAHKKE